MEKPNTKRVRYYLTKDIQKLREHPEGGGREIVGIHPDRNSDKPTYCNIIDRFKTSYGDTKYKVRVFRENGEVKEGWCAGSGFDPRILDPDEELLDGRFNF